MSTGQNYSGKGDSTTSTQQNGSAFEQTVQTAHQGAHSGDEWINLSLYLGSSENNGSEAERLYWVFEDAIHTALCEIEKRFDEDDDVKTHFEDIRLHQDLQQKLFWEISRRVLSLLKRSKFQPPCPTGTATGLIVSSPIDVELLQTTILYQQREIDQLTKDLEFSRQIVLKSLGPQAE